MFAAFNQSLSLRNKIKVDYTQLLIRLQSMNSSTVPPPPPAPNVDYLRWAVGQCCVGPLYQLTNCSFSVPIICVSIVLVVVLMMVDCVSSPPRSRHHSAHPARSVAAVLASHLTWTTQTIIPQTPDTLTSSKFCKNIFPKMYIFSRSRSRRKRRILSSNKNGG